MASALCSMPSNEVRPASMSGCGYGKIDLSSFNQADRLIYKRGRENSHEVLDGRSEAIHPEALAGQSWKLAFGAKTTGPRIRGAGVIVIRTEAEHSDFIRYRPAWRDSFPHTGCPKPDWESFDPRS